MRFLRKRSFLVTLAVLLVLGLAVALFAHREYHADFAVMAADTLFCQATVVLFWGACLALGNLKMFTSFTYSFKRLHDVIRNRQMKSGEMKEDYLKYRESRAHHDDVKPLLLTGAVLLAASVVLSVLVTSVH